jgi:hypothetical protein
LGVFYMGNGMGNEKVAKKKGLQIDRNPFVFLG